jgi:hypothetical protein
MNVAQALAIAAAALVVAWRPTEQHVAAAEAHLVSAVTHARAVVAHAVAPEEATCAKSHRAVEAHGEHPDGWIYRATGAARL